MNAGQAAGRGNSQNTGNYYIVRLWIWFLRLITPASFAYCLLHLSSFIADDTWHVIANTSWRAIIPYSEVVFFLFVAYPKRQDLMCAFEPTASRTPSQRSELFMKCCPDFHATRRFLKSWFQGAKVKDLHRDDIVEFLAWAFLNKSTLGYYDYEELDGYIRQIEMILQHRFPPRRSYHKAMLLSIDLLQIQHKPLLYYLFVVGLSDLVSYLSLRLGGFQHYRLHPSKSAYVFPWRPHTALSEKFSPSEHLSYYYLPHKTRGRRPVLFLHGFGLGMSRYTQFLNDFTHRNSMRCSPIGIIALEIMPFTTRINGCNILSRDRMVTEIMSILRHHEWDDVTILAHSVGTVIAAHLLQCFGHTSTIGPMILVDPVAATLHLGDLPFNLIYRQPQTAAQWWQRYFYGADMTIAHSITRGFNWPDNAIWMSDIQDRAVTFLVSEDDDLTEARATMQQLTTGNDVDASTSLEVARKPERYIAEQPRAAILYEGLGHGEVFDRPVHWRALKEILNKHCHLKD